MMTKKMFLALVVALGIAYAAVAVFAETASQNAGEKLFMANCTICHPDGGNIVNPAKTLHKKDREANNVKAENDIVKIMRNPGPGMTQFDEKTISSNDAHAIAGYILQTFNK